MFAAIVIRVLPERFQFARADIGRDAAIADIHAGTIVGAAVRFGIDFSVVRTGNIINLLNGSALPDIYLDDLQALQRCACSIPGRPDQEFR